MLKSSLLALLLVCLAAAADRLVFVSSTQSITVLSPAGYVAALDPWWMANRPNYIGNNAQTISVNSSGYTPAGFKGVFQGLFYTFCSDAVTTLVIHADDSFQALLNGQPIASGSGAGTIFTFKITPQCGLNNLTVTVQNGGGPFGLTCFITQNQDNCYKCGPNAFFNIETCQCQCSFVRSFGCPNPLQRWKNKHPNCGCVCINRGYTTCGQNQYFNDLSCGCQCLPTLCSSKQQQDPASCQCRCKSQSCPAGQGQSYSKCACVKKSCALVMECSSPQVWDMNSCSCQCPYPLATCAKNFVFDDVSCSCVSVQPQQNGN